MGTRRTPEDRAARAARDRQFLERGRISGATPATPASDDSATELVPPRQRHCWVRRPAVTGPTDAIAVEGIVLGWRRLHDQHGQERWFARVVIAGEDDLPQVLELPSSAVRAAKS